MEVSSIIGNDKSLKMYKDVEEDDSKFKSTQALQEILARLGLLRTSRVDNESKVNSDQFGRFCSQVGIMLKLKTHHAK